METLIIFRRYLAGPTHYRYAYPPAASPHWLMRQLRALFVGG